jgi:hypothetical protein
MGHLWSFSLDLRSWYHPRQSTLKLQSQMKPSHARCTASLAAAIAMTIASTVQAVECVRFAISRDVDANGNAQIGSFAVQVQVDPSTGGLFGFDLDLVGPIATLRNRTPAITFIHDETAVEYPVGFTAGRTANASTGMTSGRQDLSSADMIPLYGFGIEPGTLEVHRPPGSTSPVPATAGPTWQGRALLATGTVPAGASTADVHFNTSGNTMALVFVNRESTANVPAPQACIPEPPPAAPILPAGAATQPDVGTINVAGSVGRYSSAVLDITPNAAAGSAAVMTISQDGPIYLMVELDGAGDFNALSANLGTLVIGPSNPEFARLHEVYDASFEEGSFDLLLRFVGQRNPKFINFDLTGTGFTISQLAAVPEPTTLLLLSLPLLIRRPRAC